MAEQRDRLVALITGANSGIGTLLARSLADAGCNIVLADRSTDHLQNLRDDIKKGGSEAHIIEVNLADRNQLQKLVDETILRFGEIDIVVNNAGVMDGFKPAHEANLDEWEYCLDVNLRAPVLLTRMVLPHMLGNKDRNPRALIFLNAGLARSFHPSMAAYTGSKWGLLGFAGSVYEDVRDHGIKVISVLPGYVRTPMTESTGKMQQLDPEKMLKPEDVARAVIYAINQPDNTCVTEVHVRPQSHTRRS